MSCFFLHASVFPTVEPMISKLQKIQKEWETVGDSFPAAAYFTGPKVRETLYLLEKLQYDLRATIEQYEENRPDFSKKVSNMDCFFEMPCSFLCGKNYLKIITPITCKKRSSKSSVSAEDFMLSNFLEAKISAWVYEHSDSEFRRLHRLFEREELVCVLVRKGRKEEVSSFKDNDNIENGRLLNTMCRALSLSDSCDRMNLFSHYESVGEGEEPCTEITILRQKDFRWPLILDRE